MTDKTFEKCRRCSLERCEVGEDFCPYCIVEFGRVLLRSTISPGAYLLHVKGAEKPIVFAESRLEGGWVYPAGSREHWVDGVFPFRVQINLALVIGCVDSGGLQTLDDLIDSQRDQEGPDPEENGDRDGDVPGPNQP